MKKRGMTIILVLLIIIGGWAVRATCKECSLWVNSKTCWVVESPETGKIVGIILYKASVYVEDKGGEWLKLIHAPVRDIDTGELFDGAGFYIRKNNTTSIPPGRW